MARNAKNTRMCAGCMKRAPKEEFLCIKKQSSDTFIIDLSNNQFGRGVYLCRSEQCLDRAIKRKAFTRSFKCALPEKIPENIRKVINCGAQE